MKKLLAEKTYEERHHQGVRATSDDGDGILVIKSYVYNARGQKLAELRTTRHEGLDEWRLTLVFTEDWFYGPDVVTLRSWDARTARVSHAVSADAIAGERGRILTDLPQENIRLSHEGKSEATMKEELRRAVTSIARLISRRVRRSARSTIASVVNIARLCRADLHMPIKTKRIDANLDDIRRAGV